MPKPQVKTYIVTYYRKLDATRSAKSGKPIPAYTRLIKAGSEIDAYQAVINEARVIVSVKARGRGKLAPFPKYAVPLPQTAETTKVDPEAVVPPYPKPESAGEVATYEKKFGVRDSEFSPQLPRLDGVATVSAPTSLNGQAVVAEIKGAITAVVAEIAKLHETQTATNETVFPFVESIPETDGPAEKDTTGIEPPPAFPLTGWEQELAANVQENEASLVNHYVEDIEASKKEETEEAAKAAAEQAEKDAAEYKAAELKATLDNIEGLIAKFKSERNHTEYELEKLDAATDRALQNYDDLEDEVHDAEDRLHLRPIGVETYNDFFLVESSAIPIEDPTIQSELKELAFNIEVQHFSDLMRHNQIELLSARVAGLTEKIDALRLLRAELLSIPFVTEQDEDDAEEAAQSQAEYLNHLEAKASEEEAIALAEKKEAKIHFVLFLLALMAVFVGAGILDRHIGGKSFEGPALVTAVFGAFAAGLLIKKKSA